MSDSLVDAERLGVPVSWVREQTRSGAMPCVELGRYRRYDLGDVDAWLADCKRPGRPVAFRSLTPGSKVISGSGRTATASRYLFASVIGPELPHSALEELPHHLDPCAATCPDGETVASGGDVVSDGDVQPAVLVNLNLPADERQPGSQCAALRARCLFNPFGSPCRNQFRPLLRSQIRDAEAASAASRRTSANERSVTGSSSRNHPSGG